MAAFGGFTLTNRGRALQAKAQAGATLNYTKAMIGDGSITSQSVVTLTNLISPKLTLPITGVRAAPPDRAYVESRFNNQNIQTGFYFREIGIYAQDPDLGEILYAYANSGNNAEYIPPTGGSDIVEKSIRMNVFVGTATNITATIDSSLVFPTRQEVEEMIAAIEVEVVDSYESTDKTVAPSADALRRGLALKQDILRLADNFLPASSLVNAAPDPNTGREYPNGVSMFKVTSAAGGWPTANGYVLTFRAGSGGYQIFYEMYTGVDQTAKTARSWTRSKRDSNAFWQPFTLQWTETDQAGHMADYIRQPGYAVTSGTGTAYTVTLSPAPSLLADGVGLTIIPNVTSTVAEPTLNINGLGALPIRRNANTPFNVGSIRQGVPLQLVKVGSYFLARSAPPVGNATAAQVREGISFQSETVPDGGVGTFKGVDSSDATATEESIGIGKTAYVNNQKVLGNAQIVKIEPGDLLLNSIDAEKQTTSTTFIKANQFTINANGTLRVYFEQNREGSAIAYAQLYVNGIAKGLLRTTSVSTFVTYSEDIALKTGDTIEVWHRVSGASTTSRLRNFRLYFKSPAWSTIG